MENTIKKRKVKKEVVEAVGYCPHCKKEIVGSTVNQVRYNLDVHIEQKHEKKVEVK